jgi:hypothetical protein
MRSISRPGRPQRKDQGPLVYRVYRPPTRHRPSTTMVVVARVVLAAVVLALVAGLMAQI